MKIVEDITDLSLEIRDSKLNLYNEKVYKPIINNIKKKYSIILSDFLLIILLITIAFLTNNFIPILISILSSGMTYKVIKDINEENIRLEVGFDKVENKSYYKEEFEEGLDSISVDEKKYYEVLDIKNNREYLHLVSEEESLNKEEVLNQINYEWSILEAAYNIPMLGLNEKEWNNLFEVIYNGFGLDNKEEYFYYFMHEYIRNVISNAMVSEIDVIDINYFINNLDLLDDYSISSNIKNKIINDLNQIKVINIHDYQRIKKTTKR